MPPAAYLPPYYIDEISAAWYTAPEDEGLLQNVRLGIKIKNYLQLGESS